MVPVHAIVKKKLYKKLIPVPEKLGIAVQGTNIGFLDIQLTGQLPTAT